MRKLVVTETQRSKATHKRGTINRVVIKKASTKTTSILVP
jgi:hypothetical protein